MKNLIFILTLGLLSFNASAGTAFLTGESVSGLNKICYYDHLGSRVAITIKSTQLCPLTIQR